MQDRIKELVRELGLKRFDQDSYLGDPTMVAYDDGDYMEIDDVVKLAQSVVLDCINEFQRAQYRSGCDLVDGNEVGRFNVGVIGIIRARFGLATPPGDG